MKSIFFLLFISFVSLSYSQNIEGDWSWSYDNGKHSTELSIKKISNTVFKGDYCSVFYSGNKIDCYEDLGDDCINLTLISGNIYEGTLLTNFDNNVGKIRVTLISDNELLLEIIEKPSGEYYLPDSANFTK